MEVESQPKIRSFSPATATGDAADEPTGAATNVVDSAMDVADRKLLEENQSLLADTGRLMADSEDLLSVASEPESLGITGKDESRPADANPSEVSDTASNVTAADHSTVTADSSSASKAAEKQDANKGVSAGGLITEEMLAEEQELHQRSADREEEMIRQGKQELQKFSVEDRYNKLKTLLTKSRIYSTYLANRMAQQAAEEKQRRERMEKRAAKKRAEEEKKQMEKEKENSSKSDETKEAESNSSQKSGRRSLRARNTDSQNSQDSSQGSQKRGRKRKGDSDSDNNNKIEDFFSAPKRKRQRKDDSQEAEPTVEETVEKPVETETTVAKPAEAKKDVPRIINGEKVLDGQPDMFVGGVLRKYQIDGYYWLKGLYENGINGILADEMGLGKTIQCIALISHLVEHDIPGPFLVCAPLSTVPNWVAEFKRFAPAISVILYHGTREERTKLRQKIQPRGYKSSGMILPVVVTSYEIVMNDRNHLMDKDWKLLIVDEGHRIKNFKCRLIGDLKMYRSTHRLLLTGTPLQNNLSELWSLLNFLLPEIFDDLGSFETWFDMSALNSSDSHIEIVKEEQTKSVLSTIHQILTPFMLRRLKADVALNIPPKREILVYAPLTQKQQAMYKATVDKTIRSLLHTDEDEDTPVIKMDAKGRPMRRSTQNISYKHLLDESTPPEEDGKRRRRSKNADPDDDADLEDWVMEVNRLHDARAERINCMGLREPKKQGDAIVKISMRNTLALLRKSCNHPYLIEYPLLPGGDLRIDDNLIGVSGKMLLLDKMLTELKARGHKVLIFSQMTTILDILQDYCYLKKYKCCRLDGSMGYLDRGEQINTFNNDSSVFVFLLSTRAGGLGINLTAADTCIIFDSDWNPQCDLQAQDRCHRMGQTRPVLVYRLVTANTIDQRIVERAATKRKLEKMIIHKAQFKTGLQNGALDNHRPITADELLTLLEEIDYDSVVDEKSVISDADLERLLDRSDLQEKWESQQRAEAASEGKPMPKSSRKAGKQKTKKTSSAEPPQEVQGLFKIIDEDANQKGEGLPSVNAGTESVSDISEISTTVHEKAGDTAKTEVVCT